MPYTIFPLIYSVYLLTQGLYQQGLKSASHTVILSKYFRMNNRPETGNAVPSKNLSLLDTFMVITVSCFRNWHVETGVTLHRKIIEPETSISGALALLFPCPYPLISPPLPDLQCPMPLLLPPLSFSLKMIWTLSLEVSRTECWLSNTSVQQASNWCHSETIFHLWAYLSNTDLCLGHCAECWGNRVTVTFFPLRVP